MKTRNVGKRFVTRSDGITGYFILYDESENSNSESNLKKRIFQIIPLDYKKRL